MPIVTRRFRRSGVPTFLSKNVKFNLSELLKIRDQAKESRFRKFGQDDKWSFCLTAGTLCPANQERK